MNLQKLGKTEIQITPVGLGTWQFSDAQGFHKFFWDKISFEETQRIVNATLQNGINWFDTAEIYGNGRSERALRNSLQELKVTDDSIRIATKWNPIFRFAKSIKKTFSQRIENLQPYTIDLLQIHNPKSFSKISTQIKYMADLLDEGKIGSVGISNFGADDMRKAHNLLENRGYVLASNQVKYNILDRRVERNEVLDTAKELGITIIAYSPLEQGLATGKFHDNPDLLESRPFIRKHLLKRKLRKSQKVIDTVRSIATDHMATAAQIALSWLINFHGETVVAIPGASSVQQAESNAQALQITLSKEELNRLADVASEF